MPDFDIVILGAGPGGYTAAIRAAQLKARVALVERELLGGVCLNWGCIPTKALYRSASLFAAIGRAAEHGIEAGPAQADLGQMIARKNGVVEQLRTGIAKILAKGKVDYVEGFGWLADANTVRVISPGGARRDLTAEKIILATGTECAPHPVLNVDNRRVHDVRSILNLTTIPQSLLVVGGGVSGCEFAQVFSSLGSQVIMTKRSTAPIKGLDAEIEKTLTRTLKKRKYKLLLGEAMASAQVGPDGVKAVFDSGKEAEAEYALVTVGHTPLSYGLGLEEAGIEIDDHGHVPADEHGRTNLDHIYAIGDLTGQHLLAHYASHAGCVAVAHALGDESAAIDRTAVPKAVFTDPIVAWVGLTEAEARDKYGQVATGTFLLRALGRTMADGHLDGLVKVVADAKTDKVLGVHIIGPEADALIAEGALAVARGLTVKELSRTIHAHPTYPEALLEAAEDVHGLAIHKSEL